VSELTSPQAARLAPSSVSPVDAAWLRMDAVHNRMIITAACLFDEPLARADLERLLRERLLVHPRFRQLIAPRGPLRAPRWELDPAFDLGHHLHAVRLPEPAGERELRAFVGARAGEPLDPAHPLWEMHLVERAGAGAAVVVRIHHAVADGLALVGVLLGLVDEGAVPAPEDVGVDVPPTPRALGARLAAAGAGLRALGKDLLLPGDPPSPFRGALGGEKRVAWSAPIPLADVREVGRALGATVNDVVVGALAGAMRAYEIDARRRRPGRDLHALVPVNVRAPRGDDGLGNHFGLVFVALPLREPEPLERVRQVGRRMARIKLSAEPSVALEVLGAMGVLGSTAERAGIDLFTRKASVLVTNVPGPPLAVHLAGRRLASVLVWAPTAGHIATSATIISYAGSIRLGVATDTRVVPDPEAIVAAFEREVTCLRGLVPAHAPAAPRLQPTEGWLARARRRR